jgi:predicted glycoside hydrolase/deacetylase ChbG (UPF0249 family)
VSHARALIVNADDFGRNPQINEGVIAAFEHGIVTSTSLMVRWPGAEEAGSYARAHPELSVGLHLDLGEWLLVDGDWIAAYQVVPPQDQNEVIEEVANQTALFEKLVGSQPTHLDSHQHVHREDPVRSALVEAARLLNVPVRGLDDRIAYRGDFYGMSRNGEPIPGAISLEGMTEILGSLAPGISELCCHPSSSGDSDPAYGPQRRVELETLCDLRVALAIAKEKIELVSFLSLRGGPREVQARPLPNQSGLIAPDYAPNVLLGGRDSNPQPFD